MPPKKLKRDKNVGDGGGDAGAGGGRWRRGGRGGGGGDAGPPQGGDPGEASLKIGGVFRLKSGTQPIEGTHPPSATTRCFVASSLDSESDSRDNDNSPADADNDNDVRLPDDAPSAPAARARLTTCFLTVTSKCGFKQIIY